MLKPDVSGITRKISGLFFSALLFFSCATYGPAPVGGEQDVTPPKFTGSIPVNGSVNFTARQVRLNFNEFIQLKDAGKIFISPYIKGISYSFNLKQVRIDITDTLDPEVTYTVNFRNSLVDINESNPLLNFQYVFSPGGSIDTDHISGVILDAFTLDPVFDMSILLFKEKKDSLYLIKEPNYIGVTDSSGRFIINHIKKGCYYIYAVKEKSKNYAIEANEEKIAYSDICIASTAGDAAEISAAADDKDTVDIATASEYTAANDTTITSDTIAATDTQSEEHISELLMLLYQDKEPQYFLKEGAFNRRGITGIKFNYPINDLSVYIADSIPVEISLASDRMSATVYTREMNVEEARAVVKSGEYTDTLDLSLTEQQLKNVDTTAFKYSVSANKDKLFSDDSIILTFTLPLFDYLGDTQLYFTAVGEEDTLDGFVTWQKISSTEVKIKHNWRSEYSYRITVPYCTFSDFFDRSIDTSYITAKGVSLEHFGEFGISISGLPVGRYFLQLLNNKNVPVKQVAFTGNEETVNMRFVQPDNYTVWIYEDLNGNGKWDEGDFYGHLQPEKRWKYHKTIKIEADWRIEEKWIVE
jgi:hypothetical protein